MNKLKTSKLTYNVYILTLSMLVMTMVFAISFILAPKLHAEEMDDTIVANNQTYLQKTVIESNKKVVTLKKTDVMSRSSSTQISFAQALGMTQSEYDSLQDQKNQNTKMLSLFISRRFIHMASIMKAVGKLRHQCQTMMLIMAI